MGLGSQIPPGQRVMLRQLGVLSWSGVPPSRVTVSIFGGGGASPADSVYFTTRTQVAHSITGCWEWGAKMEP